MWVFNKKNITLLDGSIVFVFLFFFYHISDFMAINVFCDIGFVVIQRFQVIFTVNQYYNNIYTQ